MLGKLRKWLSSGRFVRRDVRRGYKVKRETHKGWKVLIYRICEYEHTQKDSIHTEHLFQYAQWLWKDEGPLEEQLEGYERLK